jgi:hypothetical protein
MEIKTQRTAIEKLLSASLGDVVRLGEGDLLDERTHVVHFQVLEGPAHAPTSVIAKGWRSWDETQYDPESTELMSPSMRLFNDWAGLQFLNQVMGKACPAPHFIAGDRQSGFFVMEDIGSGQNPAYTLLGSDPILAKAQMLEIATTLGRMHAATIGKKDEFDQLRSRLGPQISYEAGYVKRMISKASAGQLNKPKRYKKDFIQQVLMKLALSLRIHGDLPG